MKFLLDNWMLLSLVLVSGSMLLWPLLTQGLGLGALTATDVVTLMNQEKAVVIDVSEAEQFAAGHIRGAKHALLEQLTQKLPASVKNKETPVVFVCSTGTHATRALVLAKKLGYQRAYSLNGGMKAWRQADLPLDK